MAETSDEDTTTSTDQPDEPGEGAAGENAAPEADVAASGDPIETDDTDDTDETEDADETEDTDTSRPKPTDAAGRSRPWMRYARIGLVTAIYVGAFGTAGFLGWKLWEQHTQDQASQAAEQTAINYAQVLTSIDSNNLDQNFADVLNGATGDFKDLYSKDSMQLRQLLIDNKATAHGVVVDSAIQSASKDKVVVLLLVDQTVTNTARPDARSDSSRMKITMEKVDNRWLASKVELP